jgi:hypothetical protein
MKLHNNNNKLAVKELGHFLTRPTQWGWLYSMIRKCLSEKVKGRDEWRSVLHRTTILQIKVTKIWHEGLKWTRLVRTMNQKQSRVNTNLRVYKKAGNCLTRYRVRRPGVGNLFMLEGRINLAIIK